MDLSGKRNEPFTQGSEKRVQTHLGTVEVVTRRQVKVEVEVQVLGCSSTCKIPVSKLLKDEEVYWVYEEDETKYTSKITGSSQKE